ncbi:MAG TPA: hypothetical protein VMA73_14605 [Streptosporangiaceae bacterium]|nr:hypothetical protein [Streptosporangiaceae bacterium]
MTTNTKPRGKRDQLYALDDLFVTVHRSAAGVAWRWRTELTTLGGLLAAFLWLWGQLHVLLLAGLVLAGFLGLVFGLPWSRRFVVARIWCVLARHRFQRLCWEVRLHTRAGRVPPVLWVRPTKVGERLFVWCRAGVSAEDFTKHTGELRAACYAREARVTRNTRWSQLVTIDIIRRDTLAASHQVGTPLARLLAVYSGSITGQDTWTEMPDPVVTDDTHNPPTWPNIPGQRPAA